MRSKHRNATLKARGNRLSLMYTIHAISQLDKDELELLKRLRKCSDIKETLKEDEADSVPKIQKILDSFQVVSIQEVIDIVEDFKLFELYYF